MEKENANTEPGAEVPDTASKPAPNAPKPGRTGGSAPRAPWIAAKATVIKTAIWKRVCARGHTHRGTSAQYVPTGAIMVCSFGLRVAKVTRTTGNCARAEKHKRRGPAPEHDTRPCHLTPGLTHWHQCHDSRRWCCELQCVLRLAQETVRSQDSEDIYGGT